MFFILLSTVLCIDRLCFGSVASCAEQAKLIKEDPFNFNIAAVSDIEKYLQHANFPVFILFADPINTPVTIDLSQKEILDPEEGILYLIGNEQKETKVTIKLPQLSDLFNLYLYKIEAEFKFYTGESSLAFIQVFGSSLTFDTDCDCQRLYMDKFSKVNGNHKITVNMQSLIDPSASKSNILFDENAISLPCIPFDTDYIDIEPTKINCYANEDVNPIVSIDLTNQISFNFICPEFGDEKKIIEISLKDTSKDVNSYTKFKISGNIGLYFTGNFPKFSDYIIEASVSGTVYFNTSYAPVKVYYSHIFLKTEEFSFQDISGSGENYLHSHEDFKGIRIKVNAKSISRNNLQAYSSNIDIFYQTWDSSSNIEIFMDEESISTVTFGTYSYGNKIMIREGFSAHFSDEDLNVFNEFNKFLTVTDKNGMYQSISFGFIRSDDANIYGFIKELFTFDESKAGTEYSASIKKTKSVPKFSPNMYICNTKCNYDSRAIWFKKDNISNIYDYFTPSCKSTIVISESIFEAPFDFGKLTSLDEDSELYFESFTDAKIDVKGSLTINKLSLTRTNLNPTGSTQYNIKQLILLQSSSLFNANSAHLNSMDALFDASTMDHLPNDITKKTFLILFEKLLFSDSAVKLTKYTGEILDITGKYKIAGGQSNTIECYKEGNKPLLEVSFPKIVVIYYQSSTSSNQPQLNFGFYGNWENSFIDFFDFTQLPYELRINLEKDDEYVLPFIDLNGVSSSFRFSGSSTTICLRPDESVEVTHCYDQSKIFTVSEGLRYLSSLQSNYLDIYIYQIDDPIVFSSSHFNAQSVSISSGDNLKPKIKLPNITPLFKSFRLNGITLVLDSADDFLLQGSFSNIGLEKSDNTGKYYYYMDFYDPQVMSQFDIIKQSSYYQAFNGKVTDLTQSINIVNGGGTISETIAEDGDIELTFDLKKCGYGLKINPDIKVFYQYPSTNIVQDNTIFFTINNGIKVYVSSVPTDIFKLTLAGSPEQIIFTTNFNHVTISTNCEAVISDKSGAWWEYLEFQGSTCNLIFDTPVFNVNTLKLTSFQSTFDSIASERCKLTANIDYSNIDTIILGAKIDLHVVSILEKYPFTHMFSLTDISTVTLQGVQSEEEITLTLQPDISKTSITDEDLVAFKNPVNIVNINTSEINFNDKFTYSSSNIFGFMDGNSVATISHTEEAITFVVDKKLESLKIDLCYEGTDGNCSDFPLTIDALTVDKIVEKAGQKKSINIYITTDSIDGLSLPFSGDGYILNFVHPGETKCTISISTLSVSQFSFNNFKISSSSNYHNNKPAKYKNCEFSSLTYQNYGPVHADIDSLASLVAISSTLSEIEIDSESKIDYFVQLNNILIINDHKIKFNDIQSLTLNQQSLTNGMTLSLFNIRSSLTINLQSDLEVKIAGSLEESNPIFINGEGKLTCNVIDTTKDFSINGDFSDRIVKKLVETSKVLYCVEHECANGVKVTSEEIGETIQNDITHDIIEVSINDKSDMTIKETHIEGKYVHIKSDSDINITIESDSSLGAMMLNLTNIEAKLLTESNNFNVFSLSLVHSRITSENAKSLSLSSFALFDMHYMVPIGCIPIFCYWTFTPTSEATTEISNFDVFCKSDSAEFVVIENSEFKIVFDQTISSNADFYNNNEKIMSLQMSTKIIKIRKDDITKSLSLVIPDVIKQNQNIQFRLPTENTALTFHGETSFVNNPPSKLILLGDAVISGSVSLDSDVAVYADNSVTTSCKLKFSNFDFMTHKISLNSGNLNLEIQYILGGGGYEEEIPITLTLDEKGISTFNIINSISVYNNDWITQPIRVAYQSPPIDDDLKALNNKQIGYYNCNRYNVVTTIKYIYETKYHGLWEGNSVLDLKTTGNTKLEITVAKTIKELPMKICIGAEPLCSDDSIAINNDFALSDRVPSVLDNLEISIAKDNVKKIDFTFDSKALHLKVKSLNELESAGVTLENVQLVVNSLELNSININSDDWNCTTNELTIHNCQIPDVIYNFTNKFTAVIDYSAFKVMQYHENMKKLTVDQCNALKITFTSKGWKLDDTVVQQTDFEVIYQNTPPLDLVTLEIEEGNTVCYGMKIVGNIKQIHCKGELSWRSPQIIGEIIWDHGDSAVTLKSDTFRNPITLVGSGTVTQDLAPLPEQTSLCFYEESDAACTATNKHALSEFSKVMQDLVEINVHIEFSASSTKKISASIGLFNEKFIEIESKSELFTVEVTMTDKDYIINSLKLNKITFDITGSYAKTLTINKAEFSDSSFITTSFTKSAKFGTLVTDSKSLPANIAILKQSTIKYDSGDLPASSIELVDNEAEITFNGIPDTLAIANTKSGTTTSFVINTKITIKKELADSTKITFNDLTETDKTVTLNGDGSDLISKIILDLKGESKLQITGSWEQNSLIDVSMKGKIEVSGCSLGITMKGAIAMAVSNDLSFRPIAVTSNLSISSTSRNLLSFKSISISRDSYVNLESDKLHITADEFTSAEASFVVFPVTFAVTGESVSSLNVPSIAFSFSKVQIKSVATTAPKSVVATKSLIGIQTGAINPPISLVLLSDKKFLGYYSESNCLELEINSNGISLKYNDFSDLTLYLCFTETCPKGFVVTDDTFSDMIPPGHKYIDIELLPSKDSKTISLPEVQYEKVTIHEENMLNKPKVTLSPNTISILELENIEMDGFSCPSSDNFEAILITCNVKFTNVKDTHLLVADITSLRNIENDNFNFQKLRYVMSTTKDFTFHNDKIQFEDINIAVKEIEVECTSIRKDLKFTLASSTTSFLYSFSIITAKDVVATLEGGWHVVTSSGLSIVHDSYSLTIKSTDSYSDPFLLIGDGQVTKQYKPRAKTVICACKDTACTGCPEGVTATSYETAKSTIEGLDGEESSLELYVLGSSSDNGDRLSFDISTKTIPVIKISSLRADTKEYLLITFNTNSYESLEFNNIDIAASGSNVDLSTREIKMTSSTFSGSSLQSIISTKAVLDSIDIGTNAISVIELISIQPGFDTIVFGSSSVTISGGGASLAISYVDRTTFDLVFSSGVSALSISESETVQSGSTMNINIKSETKVNVATSALVSFVAEEKVTFVVNKAIAGSINCLKEASFEFEGSYGLTGKVTLNGDTTLLAKESISSIDLITIGEIVIKGIIKVSGFGKISKISFTKLTIEDVARTDFPFVFTLNQKCTVFEIGDIVNTKAKIISFEASSFNDLDNLLGANSNVLIFNSPQNLQFSMIWLTEKKLHGMWNGNSIFTLNNDVNTVSLVPKFNSLSNLPAEICIYDSVESVCGASSITVGSSEAIDFTLFPSQLNNVKILVYPLIYSLSKAIRMYSGDLFEIKGAGSEKTEITLAIDLNNYQQVNMKNLKIITVQSKTLSVSQSNIDLSGSIFESASIDFPSSTISLDYETFASNFANKRNSIATHIKISKIPTSIEIKDANRKYPYINKVMYADSYEWIGPSEESRIKYFYGRKEYTQTISEYKLNGKATITIENYDNSEFNTNLKFITNGNKVYLKGIDRIPEILFDNVGDVSLNAEEVEASSEQPPILEVMTSQESILSPGPPAPEIVIVKGDKDESGNIVVDTYKPTGDNVQLVGGVIDGVPDYDSSLIINDLEVHDQKVEAVNLVIGKTLVVKGDSVLKPSGDGKIELKQDDTVEINFESDNAKLPHLDLGLVGADYHIKPKSFVINMDLTQLTNDQILSEFEEGKVIVSGRTLNCEDWIETMNISEIVTKDNLDFVLACSDPKSRLLSAPQRDIILKVNKPETPSPTPKNNMVTIIVVVVVVVVVILIVIVVVVIKKKKRESSSSSSSSSSSNKGKMDEL